MIWSLRVIALLSFLLCGLAVVRPKSGGDRLALFVPKLFAGSRIVGLGAIGSLVAGLGWLLLSDLPSAGLGVALAAQRFQEALIEAVAQAQGGWR